MRKRERDQTRRVGVHTTPMIDSSTPSECFVCLLPGTATVPLLHRLCGCNTVVHAACMQRTLNTVASYSDGTCAVCKRRIVGAMPQLSYCPPTSARCLIVLCIALLLFAVALALTQVVSYMVVHELGIMGGDSSKSMVAIVLIMCGVISLVVTTAAMYFLHLTVAYTPGRRVLFRMRFPPDPSLLM